MLLEKWIKLFLLLVIFALLLFCSTLKTPKTSISVETKKDLIEEVKQEKDMKKDMNKKEESCNTCEKGSCSGLGSNSGPKSCSEGGKSCNALLISFTSFTK